MAVDPVTHYSRSRYGSAKVVLALYAIELLVEMPAAAPAPN